MRLARTRTPAQSFTNHPVYREIERLHALNFTIIPLGGEDGKQPLVRGWHERKRLPLDAIFKIMMRHGSLCYGVRLDGLVVVDLDTETPQARAYIRGRFGEAAVTIRTSRGSHGYFALGNGTIPKVVRSVVAAIDFKSGRSAFCVGPGSIRPDGQEYIAKNGILGETPLSVFVDDQKTDKATTQASDASTASQLVPDGERNDALCRAAIHLARDAGSAGDIENGLRAFRDHCEYPSQITDDDLREKAEWAWGLRCNNKLYLGRNSEMKVSRLALDLLLSRPGGTDAFALYAFLIDAHGHLHGKRFAVVPDAIKASGRLAMPRKRLYAARRTLMIVGLIIRVVKGRVKEPDQFLLGSPVMAIATTTETSNQ